MKATTTMMRSSRPLFRLVGSQLSRSSPSGLSAPPAVYHCMHSTMTGSVTTSLEATLRTTLQPTHLEIRNESYKHKGPKDAESHFQVIVVSEQFDNLPLIKRHRLVNQACQSLLDGPIHALSIVAKTPQQWQAMQGQEIPATPNCRGGH